VIGPGWMPSRPRPLGRRRWLWQYAPRRRSRRRRATDAVRPRPDAPAWEVEAFDGRRVELPTATLRPRHSQDRHRVARRHLAGWLSSRWGWLRPRGVPILAALAGMLAVLGATQYLSDLARGEQPAACSRDRAAPPSAEQPAVRGLEVTVTR